MESTLSTLDFVIIALYLVAVLYVGWTAGRRESSEGFLLADRNLGALESAASICASKTGGGLFLIYIAYIFAFGTSAFWIFIGFAVGYIIFYLFAGSLKDLADEKRFYTLPDYFFYQYGPLPAYSTAISLLCFYLLAFSAQLVGGAKILASLSGMSYALCIVIMGGIVVVYIAIGGFKAVVRTDFLQYIAIFVLTVLMAVFLFDHFEYVPSDISLFKISPAVALALFIGSVSGPFTAADLWQKVYATKSKALAKRSLLYAIVMYLAFGVVLSVVGLIIKAIVPAQDVDMALVIGFQQLLPAGMMGLGIVVLYAALMSSADTNLFTTASLVVQDLYENRRDRSDPKRTAAGVRVASILIGVGGLVLSALVPELIKLSFMYMGFAVTTASTVLLSWAWRKVPAVVLFGGNVASLVAVLLGSLLWQDQRLVYASAGAFVIGGAATLVLRSLTGRNKRPEPVPASAS